VEGLLRCGRGHRERDVVRVQETELGHPVRPRRASDAAGVRPPADALLEEEPVQDQLAAPLEELEQRPRAVGPLEAVVALDAHHRHPLARRGQAVDLGGDGLLMRVRARQRLPPVGGGHDGRLGDDHGGRVAA